jgi:2,3-bisphosphoglycerate-dependent phosphoglycerate mutase
MSSTYGTHPRKARRIAAFFLTCATLFPSLAFAQLIVYVARHGQTEWNREGRIQGSTDNPLNSVGREQAAALGALLANIKIDAVYVSSLQRTRQTAAAFEGRSPITPMDELRERHYGKFEGANERDPAILTDWNKRRLTLTDDMEGGETLAAQAIRADAALRKIRERHKEGGAVLIVAHGGINPLLVAKLIDIPPEEGAKSIGQSNDEVYRIEIPRAGGASIWKMIPRNKLNEL